MTYSIVALDAATGELGVGVETHQPFVGSVVPWVEGGLGAVATQSFANVAFGPQALGLLRQRLDAAQALTAILAADPERETRQVAIVDARGIAAVHTGNRCIPFAGHHAGDGYSVQANMMARDTVPEAMASTFESTTGPLGLRILAALEAAQAEGGDIRGQQSAAIVVKKPGAMGFETWDMRVDNSHGPLGELRRLVDIRRARDLREAMNARVMAETGTGARLGIAREEMAKAQALYPSDEELFWFALETLVGIDALDEAEATLRPLFERAPQWRELLLRLELPPAAALKPRFAGA